MEQQNKHDSTTQNQLTEQKSEALLTQILLEEFVSGLLKEHGERDPDTPNAMVAKLRFPEHSINTGESTVTARASKAGSVCIYEVDIEDKTDPENHTLYSCSESQGLSTTQGTKKPYPVTSAYESVEQRIHEIQEPINRGEFQAVDT